MNTSEHHDPGDGGLTPGVGPAARSLIAGVLAGIEISARRSRGVRTPLVLADPGSVQEALAALSTIEQMRAVLADLEVTWLTEATNRDRAERRAATSGDANLEADVNDDAFRRSLSSEVAMAERTAPPKASRLLGVARVLTHGMPGLRTALAEAWLPLEQVTTIAQLLSEESEATCRAVDEEITAHIGRLDGMGTRRTQECVRGIIAEHSAPGEEDIRADLAARRRHVRCTPLSHGMARITADLRAVDARRIMETVTSAAAADRSRGVKDSAPALTADHLVNAVCEYYENHLDPDAEPAHRAAPPVFLADDAPESDAEPLHGLEKDHPARGPRLEIGIVITDRALLGREDAEQTAHLSGYGLIPAGVARDMLQGRVPGQDDRDARSSRPSPGRGAVDSEETFFRRLYTDPDTGELVAMDARSRTFPSGLRRMIRWRDATCRTPWCNAEPRQIDHITPVAAGGGTSFDNGQGLCVRCNLAKEDGGWRVTTAAEGSSMTDATAEATLTADVDVPTSIPTPAATPAATSSPGTRLTWRSRHGAVGSSPTPRLQRTGQAVGAPVRAAARAAAGRAAPIRSRTASE